MGQRIYKANLEYLTLVGNKRTYKDQWDYVEKTNQSEGITTSQHWANVSMKKMAIGIY